MSPVEDERGDEEALLKAHSKEALKDARHCRPTRLVREIHCEWLYIMGEGYTFH